MAMRPEQVLRIAGEENVDAPDAMILWKKESSQGTDPNAKSDFQITRKAFSDMMPGADFSTATEEDKARAAMRYFATNRDAQGGSLFSAYAAFNGGPKWRDTMQDPTALERHRSFNAGKTPVDYATDAITQRNALAQSSVPSSGEGTQVASLTYDPLGNKAVAGSDRFLPVKQSTSDILKGLYADLSSLGQTVKARAEAFDAEAESIKRDHATNTVQQVSAIQAVGQADANVILATQAVDSTMASNAARTLSDANVNTSDVNSQLAHNLREMAGFQRQAEDLRSRIQANSVDFLEDPVKWVQNLIDMPPLVRKHNQALYDFETTKAQTDAMIGVAHNANVANNAKRATLADAEASAKATLSGAKANELSLQVQEKELSTNTQLFVQKQIRDSNAIHQQIQLAETLMRQTDLEQQQLGRQLAAEAEAASIKQAHDAGAQIGWNINSRKDITEMPGRMRERVLNSINTGTFGATPLEAYETTSAGDRNIMPPTTSSLLPFVTKLYRTGAEEVQKKRMTYANQADMRAGINDTMVSTAQKFLDDVHLSDSQVVNPYLAPSAKEMIAQPSIQKLQIGKLLQESMATAPAVQMDDKQIIALVRDGYTKGTAYSDIQQAANDLVQYYRKAVEVNKKAHNFYGFRLPEQESYTFAPDGGHKVDFTNYEQVLDFLLRGAKQSIRQRIEEGLAATQAILP